MSGAPSRNRTLDEVRRVRPPSLEDQPESFEPAAEEVDPLARPGCGSAFVNPATWAATIVGARAAEVIIYVA